MTRLQFLGKNIKKYRLQSNYSQEFLAEKCDLSREYISRIESGQKYVSLKKIFLIADVLKVSVNTLFAFK